MAHRVKWSVHGGTGSIDWSTSIERECSAILCEAADLAAAEAQTLRARASEIRSQVKSRLHHVGRSVERLAGNPRFWLGMLSGWVVLVAIATLVAGKQGLTTAVAAPFVVVLWTVSVSVGLALLLALFSIPLLFVVGAFDGSMAAVRRAGLRREICSLCEKRAEYVGGACADCIHTFGRVWRKWLGSEEETVSVAKWAEQHMTNLQRRARLEKLDAEEDLAQAFVGIVGGEAIRRVFEKQWGAPAVWDYTAHTAIGDFSRDLDTPTLAKVKRIQSEFGYPLRDIRVSSDGRRIGIEIKWQFNPLPGTSASRTLAV